MPDSEPTHDNPRNTRNLPAVVQEGEVMRPVADNWLTRAIRTLFGWKPGSVRDDLQVVLDASTPDEVGFSAIERTMLRNILSLHERRIADVMIHRADIVAVKRDIPLGELMSLFESAAHSRLVVYDETLDDPEGIVHIRDLLAFMTARARISETGKAKVKRKKPFPAGLDLRAVDLALPLSEANIIRKLLFVPPSMRAIDLLAQMQASRIHLALVVDEYGGTDGLVSIEDIVEQIVGEIDDEHDSDEPPSIVRQADNSFIADARASLDDVRSVIGEEFVTGEAGEEVETLGGYLVTHVGRLPVRGEVISGPGNFEIEVLDADPRRVKRLRIATRKERSALRTQRESRRREATAETGTRASQRQYQPAGRWSRLIVTAARNLRAAGLAIILAWGWKRAAIALVAGALSALAMAPFNAWPVLFATFPVAVWLIDGAGAGRLRGVPAAAMAGWWFGLGYFVPGLYWIGYAFLVDAPTFAWLLPFAILGLPAYLALFTALGFALARLIWTRDASRVIALAASLTLSEWLRGHALTGFRGMRSATR